MCPCVCVASKCFRCDVAAAAAIAYQIWTCWNFNIWIDVSWANQPSKRALQPLEKGESPRAVRNVATLFVCFTAEAATDRWPWLLFAAQCCNARNIYILFLLCLFFCGAHIVDFILLAFDFRFFLAKQFSSFHLDARSFVVALRSYAQQSVNGHMWPNCFCFVLQLFFLWNANKQQQHFAQKVLKGVKKHKAQTTSFSY